DLFGQTTISAVLRLLEHLPDPYRRLLHASEATDLPTGVRELPARLFLSRFLESEPQFQYKLEPNLLMRHASGQLYQEAQIPVERQSAQRSLFHGIDEA